MARRANMADVQEERPLRPPPPIPPGHSGFTEEWLHNAIAVISEVIVLHGPQYAPWLDRLERELEELQRKRGEDPVSRAKRHLARLQHRG